MSDEPVLTPEDVPTLRKLQAFANRMAERGEASILPHLHFMEGFCAQVATEIEAEAARRG